MSQPRISIVAALSEKNVIGKDNKIPWHIKEDLVRLKNLTIGHVTILGKNTFTSMLAYYEKSGKPTMSMRTHIVVTTDTQFQIKKEYGFVAHSIDDALTLAKEKETEEIFIIGGAKIFEQMIPFSDRLYLTIVKGNFDGDTFFPDYSQFSKVIEKEEKDNGEYKYTFLTLEK